MSVEAEDRSPGAKLLLAILVAAMLSVPLFMVWMLVYDREFRDAVIEGQRRRLADFSHGRIGQRLNDIIGQFA